MDSRGELIATASIDRKITVRRIFDGDVEKNCLFESKTESPVVQLLFDSSEQHLAIRCQDSAQIWSVQQNSSISYGADSAISRVLSSFWVPHPFREGQFVAIGPSSIAVFNPVDLGQWKEYKIDHGFDNDVSDQDAPPPLNRRRSSTRHVDIEDLGTRVDHVMFTPSRAEMLVQLSEPLKSSQLRRVKYVLLSLDSASAPENEPAVIPTRPLPTCILSTMVMPLGFVIEDDSVAARDVAQRRSLSYIGGPAPTALNISLAFIDRDIWVRL